MGFAMGLTMLVAPSAMSLLVQATGGYGTGFGLCVAAAALAVLALRAAPGRAASPVAGIAVSSRHSRSVP